MSLFEDSSVIAELTAPVARVLLNRPEYQNAVNSDLLKSLRLAFESLCTHKDIRVVLVGSTSSEVFSVGLDVRSVEGLGPAAANEFFDTAQRAIQALEDFEFPVIAVVEGAAIGAGLEIALACDIILASSQALFGQPEANFGLIPFMGGLGRLQQRCGRGVAARLLFAGEILGAQEAYEIGLVDKLFPQEDLVLGAKNMAKEISMRAPLALKNLKMMLSSNEMGAQGESSRLQLELLQNLYSTYDCKEGMQAFLSKTVPEFKGK